MVAMVAQHECNEFHPTVLLPMVKMAIFMLCTFYHNKKLEKSLYMYDSGDKFKDRPASVSCVLSMWLEAGLQELRDCSTKLHHALGVVTLGFASTYTTFRRLQGTEEIFSQRSRTDEVLRKL